jgi:hypothetical protein
MQRLAVATAQSLCAAPCQHTLVTTGLRARSCQLLRQRTSCRGENGSSKIITWSTAHAKACNLSTPLWEDRRPGRSLLARPLCAWLALRSHSPPESCAIGIASRDEQRRKWLERVTRHQFSTVSRAHASRRMRGRWCVHVQLPSHTPYGTMVPTSGILRHTREYSGKVEVVQYSMRMHRTGFLARDSCSSNFSNTDGGFV